MLTKRAVKNVLLFFFFLLITSLRGKQTPSCRSCIVEELSAMLSYNSEALSENFSYRIIAEPTGFSRNQPNYSGTNRTFAELTELLRNQLDLRGTNRNIAESTGFARNQPNYSGTNRTFTEPTELQRNQWNLRGTNRTTAEPDFRRTNLNPLRVRKGS